MCYYYILAGFYFSFFSVSWFWCISLDDTLVLGLGIKGTWKPEDFFQSYPDNLITYFSVCEHWKFWWSRTWTLVFSFQADHCNYLAKFFTTYWSLLHHLAWSVKANNIIQQFTWTVIRVCCPLYRKLLQLDDSHEATNPSFVSACGILMFSGVSFWVCSCMLVFSPAHTSWCEGWLSAIRFHFGLA